MGRTDGIVRAVTRRLLEQTFKRTQRRSIAMRRTITLVGAWLLLVLVSFTAGASAQGVQTGTIRGIVKDQQDLPVPGVTVTATSGSLPGPRSAVTNNIGLFTITALPARASQ